MRRACALSLLLAGTALAQGAAGVDVGVVLKGEPDGRHTARPGLALRGEYAASRHLALEAAYSVSFVREGARFFATTWEHGLDLRADFVLPLATSRLVLGAGPAGRLFTYSLYDEEKPVASRTGAALGLGLGGAVVAQLGRWHFRAGADATWVSQRWDMRVGVGALLPFGGGAR